MNIRHNDEDRPLCIGDNNTCPNLAGFKQFLSGKRRYHTRCDKHRRDGHDAKAFRNPHSKRYIPLNKCDLCNNPSTDRHRIIPGSKYGKKEVVTLCKDCHQKVHTLYELFSERGYVLQKVL